MRSTRWPRSVWFAVFSWIIFFADDTQRRYQAARVSDFTDSPRQRRSPSLRASRFTLTKGDAAMKSKTILTIASATWVLAILGAVIFAQDKYA